MAHNLEPQVMMAGESEDDRLKRLEEERLMHLWRESQANLRSNIGSRLGMDDYFKVSSALAGLDSAGAKQVNAPRIAMGGRGSFSMPSGGLTASSVSKMMGVQDADILARIIHMQSQAGLDNEEDQAVWYESQNLDPVFFEAARDAFRKTLGEGRKVTKHGIEVRTDLEKQMQAMVNAQLQAAYLGGDIKNVNYLNDWLDEKEIPSQFRGLALEHFKKLTGEQRSVSGEIRTEETHGLETTAKRASEKKTTGEVEIEKIHRRATKEVIALVTNENNPRTITDAMLIITPKYEQMTYWDAQTVLADVEAQVGTREQRKTAIPSDLRELTRQEQILNFPRYKVDDFLVKADEITAAQNNTQRLFITEMMDRDSKNPLRSEIYRPLREAQVWDHIRNIKRLTPESEILDIDIKKMQTNIADIRGYAKPEELEGLVSYEIEKFAKLYGIPYNMALYLYDEKAYIGSLASVRQ